MWRVMGEHRKFLEDLFSHYSKGEMDPFFSCFDAHVQWVVHGEHELAGSYKNVTEAKDAYRRYTAFLRDKPKHRLRHLLVEGDRATALLLDEVVGCDGKNYAINYAFFFEISKDGRKILKVDNIVDGLPLANIVKASTKKRLIA